VRLKPEDKQLFTDALMFRHRPEVGRVFFIAAPRRGSGLASHPIGHLGSSLVKMPLTILRTGRDALSAVVFETDESKMKRIPNSVDTLAPTTRRGHTELERRSRAVLEFTHERSQIRVDCPL
jgi:hypothetical protein